MKTTATLSKKIALYARRSRITPNQYIDLIDNVLREAILPRKKKAPLILTTNHNPAIETPEGWTPASTGADFLAQLKALDLPAGYGDPNIDAVDIARQIRKEAENRSWRQ